MSSFLRQDFPAGWRGGGGAVISVLLNPWEDADLGVKNIKIRNPEGWAAGGRHAGGSLHGAFDKDEEYT